MVKAYDTKGYSAAGGRLLVKQKFSPTKKKKNFRPLQNQIFFSLSSNHPWEISDQIMNYLCLLYVTNFG